jgi:hypothetical protein
MTLFHVVISYVLMFMLLMLAIIVYIVVKGKAVPLQTWSGPEGSRKLRFLDFMKTTKDGGKAVSLTHRPPLPHEINLVLICFRG